MINIHFFSTGYGTFLDSHGSPVEALELSEVLRQGSVGGFDGFQIGNNIGGNVRRGGENGPNYDFIARRRC